MFLHIFPKICDEFCKHFYNVSAQFSKNFSKIISVLTVFGNRASITKVSNNFYRLNVQFCFLARIRGSAASLATAFNWSCTFIVTKTFSDLRQFIGYPGTFWLFGGVCLASMIFTVLCVPETQGKSLEDIERNLTGGTKGPVRHVRRMSSIAHLKPLPMAV